MKIKANKILAVLCVIAMLMTMIVPMTMTASAAETATLSFADKAQRTSFSTSKQVWEQNGITLTNDKGSSTSNVADYANPARFYKSSKITIEAPGNITSIVFTCNTTSYATALKNSIGSGATASGSNVTVALDGTSNTYVIANLSGGQVRMNSLSVTYVTETVECAHENTVTLEAKEATCSAEGLTEGEKCEDCGITITPQESIAKIPHNFVDDVCSECGEIKPDTTLTIEQAIEIGESKASNEYTEGKYYVAGIITEIYNTTYGNMYISDGENTLCIYGTYSDDGKTRFDAMTTKPVVGDTVIIYGIVGNYGGTAQIKNGWLMEIVQDDATAEIRERLNAVNAYMQLSYKYVGALQTVEVPAASTVVDTLNRATTDITGTNYGAWSGKVATSNAVYAGQSAGGNDAIQLRSNNSNSGIITTTSGGKATKITVAWNSNTSSGRTIDVYGKNSAYESPTDLYAAEETSGTKLGSIVCGTSTELVIEGDYEYIGFRSKSGALYLDEVQITWETGNGTGGTQEVEVLSDSQFVFNCAVDAGLASIEGVTAYGIAVTAGDKTVYYTADNAASWVAGDEMISVSVALGDIINDKAKLGTEFTVRAFVEIDGDNYYSELTKTYSVATAVQAYDAEGEEVAHLFDILCAYGLI